MVLPGGERYGLAWRRSCLCTCTCVRNPREAVGRLEPRKLLGPLESPSAPGTTGIPESSWDHWSPRALLNGCFLTQGFGGWDIEPPSSCMQKKTPRHSSGSPNVRRHIRLEHKAETVCWLKPRWHQDCLADLQGGLHSTRLAPTKGSQKGPESPNNSAL